MRQQTIEERKERLSVLPALREFFSQEPEVLASKQEAFKDIIDALETEEHWEGFILCNDHINMMLGIMVTEAGEGAFMENDLFSRMVSFMTFVLAEFEQLYLDHLEMGADLDNWTPPILEDDED